MADYSPSSNYLPPHHQGRFYQHQQDSHHQTHAPTAAYFHHHHEQSNERYAGGGGVAGDDPVAGEPSLSHNTYNNNDGDAFRGGLYGPHAQPQPRSQHQQVKFEDDGDGESAQPQTQVTNTNAGGPRYFDIRPSPAPPYESTSTTPTQRFAQPQPPQPQQSYQAQPIASYQAQSQPSYQNEPQAQPQPQPSYVPDHEQQRPQLILPPPPVSYRQPSLPYLPAHPDGTIPHYTFGASPMHECDWNAPKVGQTRCYWTLLSAKLTMVFLDPVLQLHMGPQGPGMATRCILDFVHPDEVDNARSDLKSVLDQPNGTGTITRVRFLRLSAIRLALGASRDDLAMWKDQERIAFDANYLPADLVINWVADGLILCFIHASIDLSRQDNDLTSKTPWTNWCGTALMDERHCAGLARALESQYLMNPPYSTFTQGSSKYPPPISPATSAATSITSSPHQEDVSHYDAYERPFVSSLERSGLPDRIFQIMRNNNSREVLTSYPRGNYDPQHLGALAQHVPMVPYDQSGIEDGNIKTNCTRRLECSRSINDPITGNPKRVDTLFIPHGQVIFACHRVGSEEPEQAQNYHYSSSSSESYQAGSGTWGAQVHEDVPPTPSSHGSQEPPLHGSASSYPPNSYGRTESHYAGSWPPHRENSSEWATSYSSQGYATEQSHSAILHSRSQQAPSLRSTQSSQDLYPRGPNHPMGAMTSSDSSRNPVSFGRTGSSFGAQGSYSTYGHSHSAAGPSWNLSNGAWEQQNPTPLPTREIQQGPSTRYHDSYSHHSQAMAPDTPISAQPAQQYFPDTTLRPVRLGTNPATRQSPPGLKRSADDMLYSGGSASGSGDERSTSPTPGQYAYGNQHMGYDNGGAFPLHREPGGSRTSGNPPPGVQRCVSCGIDNSPEWRKGENGVKNLCNACGLRYARSKQKREGIVPQRRKKKDKAPNAKGKKPIKGKRQGSNSASPPPMMTTPPEEKMQPMDIVNSQDQGYDAYRRIAPSQYGSYDAPSMQSHHRQYQS